MSKGFFSGDAQVLLANGGYKNISQLKPGDYVLNMCNKAVEILKVHQFSRGENAEPATMSMKEIRYQNWYMPLYCSDDLELLIMQDNDEQFSEMQWVSAQDLKLQSALTSENNIYRTLLAKEFNVPFITPKTVLTLKPTYDLGLIFGLYAGYGSVNKDMVEFRFGPNEDLVEQVTDLLDTLFDAVATIKKDEYCYRVQSESEHLVGLFNDFGSKINRHIPRSYWATDDEYVRGLFDGLVEFDPENNKSRYIPITKDMAEVFLWTCSLLGLTFENDTPPLNSSHIKVFPLFVRHEQEDSYLGKVTNISEAETECSGWNLEVDCSTNSFIVNNLVVHSIPTGSGKEEDAGENETIEELTNETVPTQN